MHTKCYDRIRIFFFLKFVHTQANHGSTRAEIRHFYAWWWQDERGPGAPDFFWAVEAAHYKDHFCSNIWSRWQRVSALRIRTFLKKGTSIDRRKLHFPDLASCIKTSFILGIFQDILQNFPFSWTVPLQ